jgi:hypothetical protein
MGKYLLMFALAAVYAYVCVELPRDVQMANGEYELVQIHHPLATPIPFTDIAMQDKAQ